MSSSIGAVDGPMLRFDGRAPYPHGDHDAVVTEHWVSVCDESGAHCLTLATFSEPYKEVDCAGTPWKGYGYMTPLGGFRIEPGMDVQVRAFLFPARFDQVLAGKTVRDWIVELAATELPTVDPGGHPGPRRQRRGLPRRFTRRLSGRLGADEGHRAHGGAAPRGRKAPGGLRLRGLLDGAPPRCGPAGPAGPAQRLTV